MRKVLVTGGAGYVGAHCCKALAGAAYEPVTLDNLCHGHRQAVRWGTLVEGDISDRALLDRLFSEVEISAVIHFAAFAYVGQSVSDPGAYYRNNVAAMLNLLEAMRDHGVPNLVFSSSCATYGVPDIVPVTEGARQAPINPYGRSKLVGELMIRDFAVAHGLRAVALRYFNAAGADPEGEVGEQHDVETHLIPLALAAAGGGPLLRIFGDDYATEDGTCVRDYVHVTDLAEAHVAALRGLEEGWALPPALNLGTGKGVSIREVIAAVERVTGRPVAHQVVPPRAGDPPMLVADASTARDVLGWNARLSDLDTIIETAWRWHCRHCTGRSVS